MPHHPEVTPPAAASSNAGAFPIGASVTLEQLDQDPHPILARLREDEPVSWLPALDGWLVTRHDLAVTVMRDAARFTVDDPRFSTAQIVGLGVRRYGLSTREALLAVTLNAAYVLDRSLDLGSIEPGKRADLVLLDSPAEHVAYRLGHNPVAATFVAGEPVYVRPDATCRITRK